MKYFSLMELSRSDTGERARLDNTPDKKSAANLERLIKEVLDPLREAWGRPIKINSGYRSQAVNKAVGGVKNSLHMQGRAADITTGNVVDNRRLYDLAHRLGLPIAELVAKPYDFKWIHIAIK